MRPDDVTPTTVLAATLGVSLLAVALVAFVPSDADTTGNQSLFGDNATSQLEAVEGIEATVETVIERENGTSRTVERVRLRPATGELHATLRSSTEQRWDRRVSNGSVLWLYDRDENEVWRIDRAARTETNETRVQRLQRLFERLERARTTTTASTTPTPGIKPLPAVPRTGGTRASIASDATGATVFNSTYVGTDTVDGRSTYVVRLQSRASSDAALVRNYTQTLWLDTEYFYPLQRQTSWRQAGERTRITTTYRNVSFNPGLADDPFDFEPPGNATVETDDHDQQTYGSITALRTAASMTVPVPDVPEGFDLAFASETVVPGRVQSVGLEYATDTATLSISKSNLSWYEPRTENETVDIGGQSGEFRNLGPDRTVSWTCDGWRYSVTGSAVSKSLLIDVAESVSCE